MRRPLGLSPESTRLSTEHLTGSACNRQKANEIFDNLSSGNTKLWQPMIDDYRNYYGVYTAKLTLAGQVLLNSCAQIMNI